ncbi:hypothetical protein HPB52_011209 [Rhipicephalus sanguineus]|uniref:Uncharacterized protein n=1 Tax=Rhipicephalus sanguineus TaxID=34632 RepID=A0A9D4PYB9_RHISA|nr:hypothetical protein HPB52_011209 [Rhipicephalus sanguineus]
MLQSTVPSPETTTAFKQQWSVTRPPRPAASANTQLPGLLVRDTYVYREGREEPMSSITVFKDPPEPLIREPLHILSSTLKKPAPEPSVMARDASPIPPKVPSDARHLQSGESLNEAEASAKVIIEDRSQEPKSTGGSDAAGADEDVGYAAERAAIVDRNDRDFDANVDEADRATATGGSTSAETSTPTTAAGVAWDADSNADGRQGPVAIQEPAIPVIRGSALAQNEETLERWLTANVEGASASKGVSGDRDDVGAAVLAQVLDDGEFVDKRTSVCSGEAEEGAECLEEKAVEGEQEEEGDNDYFGNDRMVEAESLADGLDGEAAEDNALWEGAASNAQEPSAEADEGVVQQESSVAFEAEDCAGTGAMATGEKGSDESDDDEDHRQVGRNRDYAGNHEDRGQGRQGAQHEVRVSSCKGGQAKAAVSAPAKALGQCFEKGGIHGDGDHPPAAIDPSTERPTILESTDPASDVPVLPPEPLPPLSIMDSTPATAPCTVAFAAESCAAPLAARGDSTITDEPAGLAAVHTPVLIPVEARDTAYTTVAEPAFALHASRFPNTWAPAAQALVDCQPITTSHPTP